MLSVAVEYVHRDSWPSMLHYWDIRGFDFCSSKANKLPENRWLHTGLTCRRRIGLRVSWIHSKDWQLPRTSHGNWYLFSQSLRNLETNDLSSREHPYIWFGNTSGLSVRVWQVWGIRSALNVSLQFIDSFGWLVCTGRYKSNDLTDLSSNYCHRALSADLSFSWLSGSHTKFIDDCSSQSPNIELHVAPFNSAAI